MKRWVVGSVAFFFAFGFGTVIALLFVFDSTRVESVVQQTDRHEIIVVEHLKQDEVVPEFKNVKIPDEFESGDFHHFQPVFKGEAFLAGCELTSETRGPWLGMFKEGDQYNLKHTHVSFGQPRTDDFGSYMRLRFRNSDSAYFLISHSNEIKPGLVTTLYSDRSPENDDTTLLGAGFRSEFLLGQKVYVLRVTSGTDDNGGPVEVLVLESEAKRDFLYFSSQRYGESNFGRFEWVGDLDNDQRLDLLFSFFAQNGGGKRYILFISSIAKTNHLVQPFAFFDSRLRDC